MSLALPRWLRHPSPRTQDIALAAVLAVPVLGGGIADAVNERQPLLALVALAAIAMLFMRRRRPVVTLAALVVLGIGLRESVILVFPAIVALYTVASTRPGRWIAAGVVALLGAVVVHRLAWGLSVRPDLLLSAVECGAAVAIGLGTAARRANMDALRERAERLDRERELLAEQAVTEERVRIAQELHDVVAHNVSLMVVKAQALGATVAEPPIVEATDDIAQLGRDVMVEMHRTLKLLRTDGDAAGSRAPRPGLGSLAKLVEQSRAAGLRVDLAIEGTPRTLSESLDLSSFRIVQEALTNVRKHADGARARVTVGYRPAALELTIRDDGHGRPNANPVAGGHGLTGMRERAALFGGTLTAGPRESEGFEVHAILPYSESAHS